jgi:hypothetical protein
MSARHKLNAAAVTGAAVIAGLVGGLTGSWNVFVVAVAFLLVASVLARNIRLRSDRR